MVPRFWGLLSHLGCAHLRIDGAYPRCGGAIASGEGSHFGGVCPRGGLLNHAARDFSVGRRPWDSWRWRLVGGESCSRGRCGSLELQFAEWR